MAHQRNTSMFTTTPDLEISPAESYLTDPSEEYTSLFSGHASSMSPSTMNPLDIMTPESFTNDDAKSPDASVAMDDAEVSSSTGAEKKQTKKRKSWGQVLPEPKTNLPPRKRAKTADEKEQRRVERVLRNRRAAQSSRERKRLEVEALEERTKKLEEQLNQADQANKLLMEELHKLRQSHGLPPFSANSLLVQQSIERHNDTTATLLNNTSTSTINPATITPDLTSPSTNTVALPSSLPEKASSAEARDQSSTIISDVAQHPAVSVRDGPGGAISSFADLDTASIGLAPATADDAAFSLGGTFSMSAAADADRWVLESGLLASPQPSSVDDTHLAGHSLTGNADQIWDITDFFTDEANDIASDIMSAKLQHKNLTNMSENTLEPWSFDLEAQVA